MLEDRPLCAGACTGSWLILRIFVALNLKVGSAAQHEVNEREFKARTLVRNRRSSR